MERVVLDSRHPAGGATMRARSRSPQVIRFGPFSVRPRSGELHKNGTTLKLQEQPFKILITLLARAGDVVTREELKEELWDNDTHVDFDHGINVAIAKIREVLGDSSEK